MVSLSNGKGPIRRVRFRLTVLTRALVGLTLRPDSPSLFPLPLLLCGGLLAANFVVVWLFASTIQAYLTISESQASCRNFV